jgi:transcriptional regulator with XRE-family HTH domain
MSREKKRLHCQINWTPEDRTRHQAIRAKFQAERPTLEQLIASGEYSEPVLQGAFWELARIMASLREERERQGLSLSEVAKRSGIDKAGLSRLEGGQHLNPTWNTLTRYAAALGKEIGLALREVPASKGAAEQRARGPDADGVERPVAKPTQRRKKTTR